MPSTAHEEYLSEQGTWIGVQVARESVLVEEYGAMVLGDHVEVLCQRTVGDEAQTPLVRKSNATGH